MREETFIEQQERTVSTHVFTVSAGMVCVCLTVIGLININSAIKMVASLGDDMTAAVCFFVVYAFS